MGVFGYRLAAVVVFAAMALWAGPAAAYEIVKTGGFNRGNPCELAGQSSEPHCAVYEVYGLQQGDTVQLTWDYVGANDVVDVDAWLSVLEIAGDTMTVEIRMTNSSVAGDGGPGAITAFGLTTGMEALDRSETGFADGGEGTVFDALAVDSRKKSKLAGTVLDLCVFGVACTGGNVNQGLAGGNTDTFTVDLVARDGTYDTGATLGTFLLKYQGADSFQLPDLPVAINNNNNEPAIPEPSTIAVLAVGLAGLAAIRRKRRSRI